jgi:hypothetical protein
MANGVSRASIDSTFEKRIRHLEEAAQASADAFRDGYSTYLKWCTPKEVKDLLDVPSLHNPAWDRNKLNEMYCSQVLAGPGDAGGTVADCIGVKSQIDFMAVEERAFRLRHATYSRCAAMAHGRLDGYGKKDRGVFSFVLNSIDSIINAGRVSS